MFLRNDLDELLAGDSAPTVSIYLPTHQAGREIRQDAIRLRNLLSTAAKRLGSAQRGPDIAELLPLVDQTAWFWVLTVTAGRIRLYQGSRWSFDEFPADLPQGIAELRDETVYEEAYNAAPTGRQRGARGLAKAQSFGPAPDELHKDQLIELLRRVSAAAEAVVRGQPAPVILAAQPEVQGHLREFLRLNELLPEGIQENPDAMPAEDLHHKAWRLLEPRLAKGPADAFGRLNALLGTGDGRATTNPEEIVKSAHYGRVEQLFLCHGETLWGRFVETQDRIEAHANRAEGDEDLFDYAAQMTLRQGGAVTLVDRAHLPPNGPAAAILRY